MPIYPFACDGCGAAFEVMRRPTAMRDLAAYPACGQAARRVFTGLTVTGKASPPKPGPGAKPT
ncbi:MAG: zinc ribbon domain-containing protein [Chloroflexi bacterium]|nr:zinc ribbon domain-containing protein [Chloroflexota bacterium]